MKLTLPRPLRGKLQLREALTLEALGILDRSEDAIPEFTPAAVATLLSIPAEEIPPLLSSLLARKRILLASSHFAITSRLSTKLKQERDRNRQRERRGIPLDWSVHQRAVRTFPALRGPVERPASYNRPAAFEALLREHPNHHKNDCPSNVEIITEACYAGELSTVLTMIEEQRSAKRQPVLLYTRKALYVGVLRMPKR